MFNKYPTLDWLKSEIAHGEDVEFGLFQHMMTLVGVGTNKDGGDPAIEYIDPNVGTLDWSMVGTDMNGALTLTIKDSGYGPPNDPSAMPVTFIPTRPKFTTHSPRAPFRSLPSLWR